jgi:predicted DNA-binding protein
LKEAHAIVKKFGVDGVIVYNMMMAHIYDEVDDIDVAEEILNRIKNGT